MRNRTQDKCVNRDGRRSDEAKNFPLQIKIKTRFNRITHFFFNASAIFKAIRLKKKYNYSHSQDIFNVT